MNIGKPLKVYEAKPVRQPNFAPKPKPKPQPKREPVPAGK